MRSESSESTSTPAGEPAAPGAPPRAAGHEPEPPPASERSHVRIALSMAAALVVAALLRFADLAESPWVLGVLDFVGTLFVRLLKMAIVPLVFASVTLGVSSIDVRALGRMGRRTLSYYLGTTAIAVVTGLALVNLVQPGRGIPIDAASAPATRPASLIEILTGIVPVNPFASLAATWDLLGVIAFSILLGIAISVVGERAEPLRTTLSALDAVMQRIVEWVMRLAPLGVFALLASVVVRIGLDVVAQLAKYMATVAGGLALHAFVTLPLIAIGLARVSPVAVFRAFSPALLTAFSTASSNATLPITMECAERRAGVSSRVAGFVLPLGATANMDGTALYEAVAALFIAQAWGIELSAMQQVTVALTATLASIGAAGVPSAGLVTMIIVLESVGLPVEGIGLLLAVDRLLDMLRTTVNVLGDCFGATIIQRFEIADPGPKSRHA